MAGELITVDDQLQFGSLVMGGGTGPYVITGEGIEGWEDMPGLDTTDRTRPSRDGSWPGDRFMGSRVVSVPVSIHPDWDPDGRTGLVLLRDLQRETRAHAAEQPLVIRMHGETLMCWARINSRVTERLSTTWMASGELDLTLQWVATDPLRYSVVESMAVGVLPTRQEGLLWTPVSSVDRLDWVTATSVSVLDWGSEGTPGDVSALNSGTEATRPTITITGPCVLPSVTNRDTQAVLEYGLTLTAGDVLVVDVRTGTVRLNGADRGYTITTRSSQLDEFVLEPGNNTLSFRAESGSAPAAMTVSWRSAY